MRTGFASPKVAFAVATALLFAGPLAKAAQLKEAQVTQIVKEVNLLAGPAEAKPAAVNDPVRDGTAVRTGADSRAELTFTDQTLARLGANTLFSFNEGTRRLDLGGGAMLLRVPKGAGGATVRTAAVTAAVTGTTIMLEYHPGDSVKPSLPLAQDKRKPGLQMGAIFSNREPNPATRPGPNAFIKLICLEGVVRMYIPGRVGESVLIRPGQMIIVTPDAKRLPDPVDVDLDRLTKTSLLYNWGRPIGSEPLVAEEVQIQQDQKAEGELMDTNLVILGNGRLVTLVDPTLFDTIDQKTNAILGPVGIGLNPIKFGPLPTITAPVPYVINSGTFIQTDPFIQTNGQTDFGRIYRGMTEDGEPAAYFFGSSSAFDATISFNSIAETPSFLPIAAFKFTSLQLSGNPTISLGNNGAPNLALISEGAITSGAPGGTLDFLNMNFVLLAAQNGSITLGGTISFANIPNLEIYARGAGSNLTLASPMSGMGRVRLEAEGSIQVNAAEEVQFFNAFAGVDFLTGTGQITTRDLIIFALNAVNFNMGQFSLIAGGTVLLGGNVTNTVNIDASANSTLFSSASLVEVFAASNINITGGTAMTFGNLTFANFGSFANIDAPTMTFFHPGGMLTMTASGDINAQAIDGGDVIGASGDLNITGDLTSRVAQAGSDINVGGNLTNTQSTLAFGATSVITVGGTLTSPQVENIGNVTADHVVVLGLNVVNGGFGTVNTVLTAGAGGITPYTLVPFNTVHSFIVSTIESNTAAVGIDFSGNNYSSSGAGGSYLQLQVNSQIFSAASGINGANFNGGDNPGGEAGSGGTFAVFSATNLSLTGTTITATTGIIDTAADPALDGGAGGNVILDAVGAVNVSNSVVQVSSADPSGQVNRRSSDTGGNITLSSAAAAGTAIAIDSTSQLLALLENTTPGPGGVIRIEATSLTGNSQINVTNGAAGRIQADKGAIDIRHFSDSGVININNAAMLADIVKIATLGDSSTLNIGGGFISATTLLRLYAGSISNSNNSTINFTASVNLSGAQIDIAANTVNIIGAATVVTTSSLAHVYTNVANYQGSGGTGGAATGTFGGAGATTEPLLSAPALGPPGGP